VRATAGPVPPEVAGRTVPATVPGCVHTDLVTAGLLADPLLGANEQDQFWVGSTEWTYETEFTIDSVADRTDLRLDGIDTFAEVRLNGKFVGETRNMNRRYRFDLRPALREGSNHLEIAFSAPRTIAAEEETRLGGRPRAYPHPYNAVRKMASSFGWDWGPDTATSGIWRTAAVEEWGIARLAEVRILGTWHDGHAVADVHVEVERDDDRALDVGIDVAGARQTVRLEPGENTASVRLEPEGAEPWGPIGYGEPNLFDAEVHISAGDEVLDRVSRRIGFRTAEVRMSPDANGTSFALVVNGTVVVVRGANWIPDDAFLHRVTRARIAERLDQVRFAGINLVRVWGGGVFESDDFYELCAERGIMVWQDFLAACAAYSEDDPLWREFEAEARDNVARLASQPALILLNGNNECTWIVKDHWMDQLGGQTWGEGYYLELFPRVVSELAPHIPYIPGSPFSPDPSVSPNADDQGTSHVWTVVRQSGDYQAYAQTRPRFVAEFGWQGPPTWATLTTSMAGPELDLESPEMSVHQKVPGGNEAISDSVATRFARPQDVNDWHWAGSLFQACAIRFAIEHFRSLHPVCTGTIVWQLNDCWPSVSWSAIDWSGRPKPLLYVLKQVYADRIITVQQRDGGLVAVVLNETLEAWGGRLRFERLRYDGTAVVSAVEHEIVIDARGSATIPIPPDYASSTDPGDEYLRIDLGGVVGRLFFAEYADAALTIPEFDASLARIDGGYQLTLTPRSVVRDLTLLIDRVDPLARVDDQVVTLDAGQTVVLSIASDAQITLEHVMDRHVLRSANELVVAAQDRVSG
jgi:beta-mannosidase